MLAERIGATTRLCDIRDHDLFRVDSPYAAVGEAARILPIQVVELGTIGGNICAGLPILNFPPVIIALNAELRVLGPDGQRSIPADEFYMDYFLTGLQPNEFLAEINLYPVDAFSGKSDIIELGDNGMLGT